MLFILQINALAAVMLLLVLFSNRYSHIYLPENHSFRWLLIHMLILLALDCTLWAVNTRQFPGAVLLNQIINHAYYAEQAVLGYLWGVYSRKLTRRELTPQGRWLHRIPMILALVLLACNPLTGGVFRISAENVYSRGWGISGAIYTVCAFYYLVEGMLLAVFLLCRSPRQERPDSWNLLLASFLPVLGTGIQMVSYGMTTIWSFGSVGLLILHFNVQSRHAAEVECELEKSRTAVMLSQIQPHFLYNSLNGIRGLCSSDPQKAKIAMEHFSYFLRGNLDSLSDERLIPFDREIGHVKDYFYLEKMRFGDRVNLVLELADINFLLPPLTIQPLVENAVRYGITKKSSGGTVTVRSERLDYQVHITIIDDGVGFDLNAPKEDERTHTGIKNVRSRLALQCGGSLHMKSEKGVGTVVRLTLPGKES